MVDLNRLNTVYGGDVSIVNTSDGQTYSDESHMSHAFWLNDLLFYIPPTSIVSQSENTLWSWTPLRSANSSKVHTGKGNQVYTIKFEVPHKGAIVNVDNRLQEIDVITEGDNTGKRGGLLDLIIQFKNTPFARIENAFLRSRLRIPAYKNMAFCLHGMSFATSPGEPGNVHVTLTVSIFNYSPYSDRWMYKEDWRTSDIWGNARFDDVNNISLPNRDRYKLVSSQIAADILISNEEEELMSIDRSQLAPAIRRYVDDVAADIGNDVIPIEVHIDYTEADNNLWPTERQFMALSQPVASPSYSAIFKDYIDWLHSEWQVIKDPFTGGTYDCTRINPYSTDIQNLGDSVKLSWKEYKQFPMSDILRNEIRNYVRDRASEIASQLTARRTLQYAVPASTESGVENVNVNGFLTSEEEYEVRDYGNRYQTYGPTSQEFMDTYVTGNTSIFSSMRSSGEHKGVDIYFPSMAAVVAPYPGRVRLWWPHVYGDNSDLHNQDYGGSLYLDFDDESLPHMVIRHLDIASNVLSRGDRFEVGDIIGATYRATLASNPNLAANLMPGGGAPHIHVEANWGSDDDKVDPMIYFDLGRLEKTGVFINTGAPEIGIESISNEVFISAQTDLPLYREYVQNIEAQGWTFYGQDLTRYDTFYRKKDLTISANSSVLPDRSYPMTCTYISGNLNNLFRQLPLSGSSIPTSQYLGKGDDTFLINLEVTGLNRIKQITDIQSLLRRQAVIFRSIPDSWNLKVENNLINATGNINFAIQGIDESTIQNNPNQYGVEIRLVANNPSPEQLGTQITFAGNTGIAALRSEFVKELLGNGDNSQAHIVRQRGTNMSVNSNLNRVIVNQSAIDSIAWGDSNVKNEYINYLNNICGVLNTINSLFIQENFLDSAWNQGFSASIPTAATDTIEAFGFGGEAGGYSYIYRNGNGYNPFGNEEPGKSYLIGNEEAEIKNFPINYNAHGDLGLDPGLIVTFNEIERVYERISEFPLYLIAAHDLSEVPTATTIDQVNAAQQMWISNNPLSGFSNENITNNSSSEYLYTVDGKYFRQPYIQVHRAVYAFARTLNYRSALLAGKEKFKSLSHNSELMRMLDSNRGIIGRAGLDLSEFSYPVNNGHRPRGFSYAGMFWGDVTYFMSNNTGWENFYDIPNYESSENISNSLGITESGYPSIYEEPYVDPNVINYSSNEFAYSFNQFEFYLWEYVAKPMLVNVLDIDQINRWSSLRYRDGTYVYPNTLNTSIGDKVANTGSAYPDLKLPQHPFWSVNTGSTYTEPDFYMYNAGIDGNAEAVAINGDFEETPQEALNRLTQLEIELSLESINRLSPGNNNTFRSPTNALNPHEGRDAGFILEYGFNKSWIPGELPDNAAINVSQMLNNNPDDEPLNTLRHSSIYVPDRVEESNPWIARENDETREGYVLEDNLSYGMVDVLNRGGRYAPDYVDWRTIAPLFGQNPNLVDTPPGFDRSYLNNIGSWWGSSQEHPVEVINNLQSISTVRAYDFMTEAPPGVDNTETFINGNWGYSDIGQWSNNRISLYNKTREALKNINNRKWLARKAYPTFKLFFIEEDAVDYEWISYDDNYTYNQIESIQISDSRKRPASLATITFLNINGLLDGNNMWHAVDRDRGENDRPRSENLRGSAGGTSAEQDISNFILQNGTKIMIKLGYSNNANKLKEQFLGEVVEVRFLEEGNKVQVVAQSFGTELVARMKGTNKKELKKTYTNSFELMASLMFEPEVLHFGRKQRNGVSLSVENQSLRQNEIIHMNTFLNPGLSIMKGIGRGVLAAGTFFISEIARAQYNTIKDYIDESMAQIKILPKDGPQDDNIFAPNFTRLMRHRWTQFRNWRRVDVKESSTVGSVDTVIINEENSDNAQENSNGRPNDAGPLPSAIPGPGSVPQQPNRPPTPQRGPSIPGPGQVPVPGYNIPPVGVAPAPNGDGDITYEYLQTFRPREIEYNLFYTTIWDVFTEMTLRHPGFVAFPRIYGNSNRMTMFFGLPDQGYWSKQPLQGETLYAEELFNSMFASTYEERQSLVETDKLNKFMDLVSRRFRPFRSWHHVNSSTDIISNNIVANEYGFYTGVNIEFVGGRSLKQLRKAIREAEDSGGPDLINPNGFVQYKDRHTEEMIAHRDLSTDNIRTKFHQFPNCRGRAMAQRYGRGLLGEYAKEMYKGSLTLLGNPDIKPYDVLIINDTYNDVSGPVEVEEVIHTFSYQTGYITEVIPDTFIIQEDITPFIILNATRPTVMLKTEKLLEESLFTFSYEQSSDSALNVVAEQYRDNILEERLDVSNAQELVEDLSQGADVVGVIATAAGTLALNPVTAIAGLTVLGASAALYSIGNYYIANYVANSRAFIMIPLIKSGKPWVEGFDLTATNTYYRSMFDLMRRWWDDGMEGLNLMLNDRLIDNQRTRDFYGNELTLLSRAVINWSEIAPRSRRALTREVNNFIP